MLTQGCLPATTYLWVSHLLRARRDDLPIWMDFAYALDKIPVRLDARDVEYVLMLATRSPDDHDVKCSVTQRTAISSQGQEPAEIAM